MRDYGSPSYWDERYAANENTSFDWYQDYSTLRPHLQPLLRKSDSFEVLIPGCGNSRLGPELYDEGYVNLTCVDTSAVAISQMSDRYCDREEMEFLDMDVRKMDVPDECFDLIIDKDHPGLFDALLCGPNNINDVSDALSEMNRVLKANGTYFLLSHGPPATRLGYLQALPWEVKVTEIGKVPLSHEASDALKSHFLYTCHKPEGHS